MIDKTRVVREISPEWDRLMKIIARAKKGSVTVIFNEGRPVQVENLVQKIALDRPDEFDNIMKVVSLLD